MSTKTKKIYSEIAQLTPVIAGTIREVRLKCGKKNCPCVSDLQKRHGPYLFWDRRFAAKISSKSITPYQAQQIQKGINNRRKLELLIQQLLVLGEEFAASLEKTKPKTNRH